MPSLYAKGGDVRAGRGWRSCQFGANRITRLQDQPGEGIDRARGLQRDAAGVRAAGPARCHLACCADGDEQMAARTAHGANPLQLCGAERRSGGDSHDARPVSYTHLTLPTILLV